MTVFFRLLLVAYSLTATPCHAAGFDNSFAHRIDSPEQFVKLSRSYKKGRLADIPHVLFAIERQQRKVYFANSKLFDFHGSFCRSTGLSAKIGSSFFRENYSNPERKLILGMATQYRDFKLQSYFVEFSDADRLSKEIVEEAFALLEPSFFAKLTFLPQSLQHETVASTLQNIAILPFSKRPTPPENIVHHGGTALGRLVIIEPGEEDLLKPTDIALFESLPVSIPPVAGIVSHVPSSPLSHLHMLARSWNIPDATLKDIEPLKTLNTLVVRFTAEQGKEPTITKATEQDVRVFEKSKGTMIPQPIELQSNLAVKDLKDIVSLGVDDRAFCGAKAANLGPIFKTVPVPAGFCIPFYYYDRHIADPEIQSKIAAALSSAESDRTAHNQKSLATLKVHLSKLQDMIRNRPLDSQLKDLLKQAVNNRHWQSQGVFVRSSTNAEDLDLFSGAGLYTTVPNVIGTAKMEDAIKEVWSSVWGLKAFLARKTAGFDHRKAMAGVLIQKTLRAESAGVLITKNPFNPESKSSIYINAKHGLGFNVVNGEKNPEQVIYRAATGATRVLSLPQETSALYPNAEGGVTSKSAETNKSILTEPVVKRMYDLSKRCLEKLKGPLDIEWVIEDGKVWFVQARRYQD
jgi:rifampicin phosphotransferase